VLAGELLAIAEVAAACRGRSAPCRRGSNLKEFSLSPKSSVKEWKACFHGRRAVDRIMTRSSAFTTASETLLWLSSHSQ